MSRFLLLFLLSNSLALSSQPKNELTPIIVKDVKGSADADAIKSDMGSLSTIQTGTDVFLTDPVANIESLSQEIFKQLPDLKQDSLANAMADAYRTNPQIKQQLAAIRASVEKTVQAKSGWRPTINGTISSDLSRTNSGGDHIREQVLNGRPGGISKSKKAGSTSAKVELRQNLFAGGQTINQTREARAAYKSAKTYLTDIEQNILLQVSSTYLSLMSKYAEIELLKKNESALKATLNATQEKFNVGEETRTSVAQAEAQLADGIAQRVVAESALEQLKANFQTATFRKPGKLSRPEIPSNIPKSLDEVIAKAQLHAPTVIKAMYDEKAARYTVDRVTGALLPSVDLVGSSAASRTRTTSTYDAPPVGITINPSNDRQVNHSVQLQMTIPLYEAGNTRSQRREAAENAEQARIRIEQARRDIVEKAITSWNKYKAAESRIVEYKRQVQANLVSLDGTQQELDVGSKILLDVLNAISKLVQSQVNLVQAEQDHLAAAYEVLFAIGQLTAKSMGLKVDFYDPDIHYRETTNSF